MGKNIKSDREKLLNILEKLKPGLAVHDSVEQTTSFVFKDGFVWSFNEEVAVSHPLPKNINLEGAVPAESLLKLLAKTSEKMVELFVVDSELYVVCGRSRAGIMLEDVKLPIEKIVMPKTDAWITLPKDFSDKLHLASLSAGKSASSTVLSCVNLTAEKAFGCDNFQLTVSTFSKPLEGIEPVLLGRNMIPPIVSFSPDAISQVENWTHFINKDDVVLSCRGTEGIFPDVGPLLAVEGPTVKLPAKLSELLGRAGVFSSSSSSLNKITMTLNKNGSLLITSRNEYGWFKESIEIASKEIEFQLPIDPEILGAALKLNQTFIVGKNAMLINGEGFQHVISLQ
jgi:hypothetical protein